MQEILSKKVNMLENLFRKKFLLICLVAAIVLGIYLDWGNLEVLIFTIFIYSIINPVPSRYFAMPALFFICLVPFLIIIERESKAEEFAIYAYYFLAMAAIMGIYEVWMSEKSEVRPGNEK